jgi:hypothetical protein
MLGYLRNLFGSQPPAGRHGGPMLRESATPGTRPAPGNQDRTQTYAKVFRYRLPPGQLQEPVAVAVAGSFNHWQPVPLLRDGKLDAWHVTLHHIPGNRTHHYMLLVDGQPTYDKTCDGLAVPHGPHEEQFQLATDKGPRVLMLFAQTR